MRPKHKLESSEIDLQSFYREVREYTLELCEPLEVEDYLPQPVVDVSPPKWNIAHTTWFFEEMILKQHLPGYSEFDAGYAFLFNSYYNTVGERTLRHQRGDLSRPTVADVIEYRKYVDAAMLELLSAPIADDLAELLTLGLNHEQQHQELFLTDLKYTFGRNPVVPIYQEEYALVEKGEFETNDLIEFTGGLNEIGFEGGGFCFDNELARHRVHLEDFSIQKNPVTNGEFIEFIDDGGYKSHMLWHAEGWDWVNENRIDAPLYWQNRDGDRLQFTLGGLRKVNPENAVCHISFYEAAAYAEWKGMRLPTEFEWEAASDSFEWGLRWEWTGSAYLPYPGFKTSDGAVGEYNGKFMVNQMVLRGASVATPINHSRKTYRNFFHPNLRWQFTGLRLAV